MEMCEVSTARANITWMILPDENMLMLVIIQSLIDRQAKREMCVRELEMNDIESEAWQRWLANL